jgi:cell division protein FtsB
MRYLQILVLTLAGVAVIFLCVLLQQKNKALDDANTARADLAAQLDKASLRIKDLTAQSAALESQLNAIAGRTQKSTASVASPEARTGETSRMGSTSRRSKSHEEDD